MFDIGWTEMMVVAVVAIVVVGPKDLPKMLRAFGNTMKSIRGLAGDFQKQFDQAVKEAELDDVKNIASGKGFQPLDDIKKSTEAFKKEMTESWEKADKAKSEAASGSESVLPKPAKEKTAKPTTKTASGKPRATRTSTSKATAKNVTAKKTAVKKAPVKKTSAKKATTGKSA